MPDVNLGVDAPSDRGRGSPDEAGQPRATPEHAPDGFCFYRIIGNDLVPRHALGQSRANVRFILEHEPELDGCEKRWVLNRIVDPQEEQQLIKLLHDHQQPFLRIPFQWDDYPFGAFDIEAFPHHGDESALPVRQVRDEGEMRALLQLYRHKINYAMNVNGARNLALADGRSRARWVLPWDGNCFMTTVAWSRFREAVREDPFARYAVVPMARVLDNEELLDPRYRPDASHEPQIAFRADAVETFDPAFPYGRRDKVDLLIRLGVPGPWTKWSNDPWDCEGGARSIDGPVVTAGWVGRLSSGHIHLEGPTPESFQLRGVARREAIVDMVVRLDAAAMRRSFERRSFRLATFDEVALEQLRTRELSRGGTRDGMELAEAAATAVLRGPFSVVDKTTLPPSGNPHDYWHPAPYAWPDPAQPDGLPYINRDGHRVPGTRLYEEGSEQFDRTSLQRMFDDTTTCALAGFVFGEQRFLDHAACLIRTWFLDSATRMNPHLRYAQVWRGYGEEGMASGIIEFKDVYFFLDAVALVEAMGGLTAGESERLRQWFEEYFDWFLTSAQGTKEVAAQNNHGTIYDLQCSAIALYLRRFDVLVETVRTATTRLLSQFQPDGAQPHELRRSASAHYCAFNLQSWINLANLLESVGVSLPTAVGVDGRGLAMGLSWFLDRSSSPDGWPFDQVTAFDPDRILPLDVATEHWYGSPMRTGRTADGQVFDATAARRLFHPHDGIPPFWNLTRWSTGARL